MVDKTIKERLESVIENNSIKEGNNLSDDAVKGWKILQGDKTSDSGMTKLGNLFKKATGKAWKDENKNAFAAWVYKNHKNGMK